METRNEVRVVPVDGCSAQVATILAGLPEWFGIPDVVQDYVEAADRLPGYLAQTSAGETVGALLVERHFAVSAEVHVMAVDRAWHRRGIGRALVEAAADDLAHAGTRLLSVKTLGASHPDVGYRGTRRFYEDLGFVPVEEVTGLWPGTPCLIMVKPLAAPDAARPQVERPRHVGRFS